MNKRYLTDKEVIKELVRTSERAYKYGTLKPKIDAIMTTLITKLDKEFELKLEIIKKNLINSIKEIK